MSWLWLAAACLMLLLLGQAKVGGILSYGVGGLDVWVKVGPARIQVWPRKTHKDKQDKERKTVAPGPESSSGPVQVHPSAPSKGKTGGIISAPEPEQRKKGTLSRLGGPLPLAKAMLPLALEAAQAAWGKIRVDRLRLKLTVGADDPGDAALSYGWANGVLSSFWTPLTQAFHVVDGAARVELDFQGETGLEAWAQITLRVYQALGLVLHFAPRALSRLVKLYREAKEHKEKEAI